jgi:hypothetical protein
MGETFIDIAMNAKEQVSRLQQLIPDLEVYFNIHLIHSLYKVFFVVFYKTDDNRNTNILFEIKGADLSIKEVSDKILSATHKMRNLATQIEMAKGNKLVRLNFP